MRHDPEDFEGLFEPFNPPDDQELTVAMLFEELSTEMEIITVYEDDDLGLQIDPGDLDIDTAIGKLIRAAIDLALGELGFLDEDEDEDEEVEEDEG